ncbi:retron St85 family RNA-directed DNA polymerase [Sporolactobacillus laevolacticus]|uniref:RNA-directed DNA polymerase n=1 Tax=Sporolactobacillus laevolacticus DSM 442 TaxID=1395513 RepID=V6J1K8_9BACL|nr:retron St85 family RNA-directed DNA polymerase [Sporolactobacillus laevolacticus]EST13712.1 hypothetical protein P343_01785 [Sporolactobacillus laevolacticus DSM 442]
MNNTHSNTILLNNLQLPIIHDIFDLSDNTRISDGKLYLLFQFHNYYYNTFFINKKNGKKREISSPQRPLKLLQKWILEEILLNIKVSAESQAFIRKKNGILENALLHKDNLFLLQMDIENFFPSIDDKRIFYFFRQIGYNSFVSDILKNVCTFKGKLPQGGVCSPYLSNLICYSLDRRIAGLCARRDIIYSRYADDLSFSCDNKDNLRKIRPLVELILSKEGFKVNKSKTRFSFSHKTITGLNIAKDNNNMNVVKVPRKLKRKVRSIIHYSFVSGDFSNQNVVLGYIAFIYSIEPEYISKIIKYIQSLQNKDYKFFSDIVNAFNKSDLAKISNFCWNFDDTYESKIDVEKVLRKYKISDRKDLDLFAEYLPDEYWGFQEKFEKRFFYLKRHKVLTDHLVSIYQNKLYDLNFLNREDSTNSFHQDLFEF